MQATLLFRQCFIKIWAMAPIAYSSRLPSPPSVNILFTKRSVSRLYMAAINIAIISNTEFRLITDNQALAWLLRHAKELGRIRRWVLVFQVQGHSY
jgi:hypothetical protein